MKPKNYILFSILCLFFILFYAGTDHRNKELLKPLTNDYYNYIDINEILMWVSNNGDGSHSPLTDGNGFYWPGGKLAKKSAIFEDGLIWGGMVNGEIRVNGNTHRQGLQAGKILSGGIAENPDDPRYRVYKIRKDWDDFPPGPERDALERDYNEWPVADDHPGWMSTTMASIPRVSIHLNLPVMKCYGMWPMIWTLPAHSILMPVIRSDWNFRRRSLAITGPTILQMWSLKNI
jgi:hypothetical protein